jgi:hypothetical protein
MSDDINGFEEDYRNLVEKFQDDELANILTGVSKEINAKIKEKKRNIQKDQQEMNTLIDKAQDAKKSLVRLTAEKKSLENTLRQVTDVFKYYSEEFERISLYTSENFDNLHPDDEAFDTDNVDEDINIDDIEIDEKEEIVTDEDIDSTDDEVVELEINEPENEVHEEEDTMEETNEQEYQEEFEEEVEDNSDDEELEFAEESIEDEEETSEEDDDEQDEEQVDFDIDNIVINDDLEDDDEESIKSFLNKDENDLF